MYSKELADLGIVVFRRQNESGGLKPHLFIRFKSESGRLLTFAIDTTRFTSQKMQPDAYLITHAHSDHYGKSAMLSEIAYCSEETARALEIRYEKNYKGKTFQSGSEIDICGVKVRTYDVYHAPGAVAFYWKNELGTRILVTGDVKDAKDLPECDVLITEASYGDPEDLGCYFKDDIDGFYQTVLSNIEKRPIAFGAYEFGKSQKAVSMIREMGYTGSIAMNEKTSALTKTFVENAGNLISMTDSGSISYEISETVSCTQIKAAAGMSEEISVQMTRVEKSTVFQSDCRIYIVPIHRLSELDSGVRKYVLTCRTDYPYENVRLSDHLDVSGLTQMVKKIKPKITIVYHPNTGTRTDKFAEHLEKNGFKAFSINRIKNIIGNEKQNNKKETKC